MSSFWMNIYNAMQSSRRPLPPSSPSGPDNLDFINMYFQGLLEKALQRNFIRDSFCLLARPSYADGPPQPPTPPLSLLA